MLRVSFHVGTRAQNSSGNKDKPAQMQMEFDGVGFVCINYTKYTN